MFTYTPYLAKDVSPQSVLCEQRSLISSHSIITVWGGTASIPFNAYDECFLNYLPDGAIRSPKPALETRVIE